MKTISRVLLVMILLVVAGVRTQAQEKVKPWSIGNYIQPVSPDQPKQDLAPRAVQPGENISTNNKIYPSTNPQTEISAAIDKNASDTIMVAANTVLGGLGQGWYATTDGGYTWSGSDYYPNGSQNRGDPVIVCNDSSHFFDFALGTSGIIVAKTTDAGQTWQPTIDSVDPTFSSGSDKPMAVVDNYQSSLHKGNLYVAWTDFATNPARVVLSKSSNGGNDWSDNLKILNNTSTLGQGTSLATGPNGEVYVAWANYPNGNIPATGMGFVVSTDGGETFSSFTGSPAFSYDGIRSANGGLPDFGGIRVNDFPCIAVDHSDSPYRGYIYAVVAADTGGNNLNSDIKFARSTDGGATWETGFTNNTGYVNTYRAKQQYFPWMSVDDVTGRIAVTYYSQDTVGYAVDTYVAISNDAGETFREYKVSDVSHTPQALDGYANGYSGDYMNVTTYDSKVYPFWMDNRSGAAEYQAYFSYSLFSVDQHLSNQTTFGEVNRWNGSAFQSVGALPASLEDPNFTNETLQGEQDIHSGEKYKTWKLNTNDVPNITNHHLFSIRPGESAYISQFHPTTNATVQATTTDGASLPNVQLKFSDPWLIDYPDPEYGGAPRNRGMDAPFKTVSSGDLGVNSAHQGVFLNQGDPGNPNSDAPHYRLRAPLMASGSGGTYYVFHQWSGSGVNYENANARTTSVVFTNNNANAAAHYYRLAVNGENTSVSSTGGNIYVQVPKNSYSSGHFTKLSSISKNGVTLTSVSAPEGYRKYRLHLSTDNATLSPVYTNIQTGDLVIVTPDMPSIPAGATINMPASSQVKMLDYSRFSGTSAEPVTFQGANGATWDGFDLGNMDTGEQFEYVTIKNTTLAMEPGAGANRIVVQNVIIDDASYGFAVDESGPMTGTIILDNVSMIHITEAGIYSNTNAGIMPDNIQITHTTITAPSNSQAVGIEFASGGQLHEQFDLVRIADVTINDYMIGIKFDFAGTTTSVLHWDENIERIVLAHNRIENSGLYGVKIDGEHALFAHHNIIASCETGYDIQWNSGAQPHGSNGDSHRILNETIVKNELGIHFEQLASGWARSGILGASILYGNLTNLDLNDGLVVQGNITSNPLFVDYAHDNYHLTSASLAIDAGFIDFDLDGQDYTTDPDDQDPDGTRMDIGALYFDKIPVAPSLSLNAVNGQHPVLHWTVSDLDIDHYKIYKHYYINKYNRETHYVNNYHSQSYTDGGFGVSSSGSAWATYRVMAYDNVGQASSWSNTRGTNGYIGIGGIGAMKPQATALPDEFEIKAPYPNPFNPTTQIDYALPVTSNADIRIFDILGRQIYQELNVSQPAGYYSFQWSGESVNGSNVPSGIYIVNMRFHGTSSRKGYDGEMDFSKIQKVMLVK